MMYWNWKELICKAPVQISSRKLGRDQNFNSYIIGNTEKGKVQVQKFISYIIGNVPWYQQKSAALCNS